MRGSPTHVRDARAHVRVLQHLRAQRPQDHLQRALVALQRQCVLQQLAMGSGRQTHTRRAARAHQAARWVVSWCAPHRSSHGQVQQQSWHQHRAGGACNHRHIARTLLMNPRRFAPSSASAAFSASGCSGTAASCASAQHVAAAGSKVKRCRGGTHGTRYRNHGSSMHGRESAGRT